MQPVATTFYKAIRGFRFLPGHAAVIANHTGALYPADPEGLSAFPGSCEIKSARRVNFARSLEGLRKRGVRLFVEVGPGSILSGLAKDTLGDTGARILTANHRNSDDLAGLQKLLAGLFVEGVPVKPICPRGPSSHNCLTCGIRRNRARPDPVPALPATRPPGTRVTYSGVSIGLPGSWKESFRDDNFDQLYAGHDLIERLTDAERQRFVDQQITKLVKDESGPSFKLLTALDDVIQLAGKIGRIDPIRD